MREKILYYAVHEVHDSQAQNAVVISLQTCDYAVLLPFFLLVTGFPEKKKKAWSQDSSPCTLHSCLSKLSHERQNWECRFLSTRVEGQG